jgi:hypothetical protein
MASALQVLPKLAPLLARHLAAYVELLATAAALLARALAQRLVAAAVALVAALLALQLACAWIVAVAWDTPWRSPVLALLLALFILIAAGGVLLATRRSGALTQAANTLGEEWASDQKLIQELTGDRPDASLPAVPPLVRLRQSRLELQALLPGADGQAAGKRFPRSTTMRLLSLIPVASLTRMLFKS